MVAPDAQLSQAMRIVAEDYDIPIEAVAEALEYYQRNPEPIKAKLVLNRASFGN